MSFIWATRGRTWGFQFLRSGGSADPLLDYEDVFSDAGDAVEGCWNKNDRVGLRFLDPRARKDRSGRVISHEFVLSGASVAGVKSVQDGLQLVWPQVEDEYADIWERPTPSLSRE